MADIDISSRLRAILEQPLPEIPAVTPVRPTPSSLGPGSQFTAQILGRLPDGNFRASVAGQTMTFSLPQGASPGETLKLVVVQQTPQAIVARPLETTPQPTPQPKLSNTGQLISQLVSGQLGKTEAAPLNGNRPILPGPSTNAAQIAPALARALSESGVFYEAHQVRWASGRLPLEQLLREPQAKLSPQPDNPASKNAAQTAQTQAPAKETAQMPTQTPLAAKTNAKPDLPQTQASNPQQGTQDTKQNALTQLTPRPIAPLVMQQLDSLISQQLSWQGIIWPGQTLQWTIDVPEREAGGAEAEAPDDWKTTLKVSMPQLGDVQASLHLNAAGLTLRIDALANALDALGIPLNGHMIARHDDR
jgi:hypothetical protein